MRMQRKRGWTAGPYVLRFMVDGERIGTDATPETLDLEDLVLIDVVNEPTGC